MSHFANNPFQRAEFTGTVRLFPVPNLVLFPNVMQPVCITEPRDLDLLADALKTDRLLATAMLAPGWELCYDARPEIRPVACLARIVLSQPLEKDAHNILLAGVRRVHILAELPSTKTYREARAMICEDIYPPNQSARREELRQKLRDGLAEFLPQLPQTCDQLEPLLNSKVSLRVLTDVLGYALEMSPSDRETLLAEVNVHRRAELLLDHLAELRSNPPTSHPYATFPPHFSTN